MSADPLPRGSADLGQVRPGHRLHPCLPGADVQQKPGRNKEGMKRRSVLAVLVLGLLALLLSSAVAAQQERRVTPCHNGQIITVDEDAEPAHLVQPTPTRTPRR